MTSCSVDVTLDVSYEGSFHCQGILAAEIARASKQLFHHHELALRISVSSAASAINVVPTAISYLGSNLHHFDTYSIPTEQPAASTNFQLMKTSPMTYQQVQDLSLTAQHLFALCGYPTERTKALWPPGVSQ